VLAEFKPANGSAFVPEKTKKNSRKKRPAVAAAKAKTASHPEPKGPLPIVSRIIQKHAFKSNTSSPLSSLP
jgi:hypothetical protein